MKSSATKNFPKKEASKVLEINQEHVAAIHTRIDPFVIESLTGRPVPISQGEFLGTFRNAESALLVQLKQRPSELEGVSSLLYAFAFAISGVEPLMSTLRNLADLLAGEVAALGSEEMIKLCSTIMACRPCRHEEELPFVGYTARAFGVAAHVLVVTHAGVFQQCYGTQDGHQVYLALHLNEDLRHEFFAFSPLAMPGDRPSSTSFQSENTQFEQTPLPTLNVAHSQRLCDIVDNQIPKAGAVIPLDSDAEFKSKFRDVSRGLLRIVDVTHDGNCFFYAFWYAFTGEMATHEQAQALRHVSAEQLKVTWQPEYTISGQTTCPELTTQGPDDQEPVFDVRAYLDKLANTFMYADQLAILSLADYFKVCICVMSYGGHGLVCSRITRSEFHQPRVFVAYDNDEKYFAIAAS
eukprot:c19910_g1_i1.p1 GENE.c19910_g1_i1~~c19910_g1_i1.p1  ORF type:complete len:409 (+),score=78.71 c19910_g1_i1:824-2050(+)